MIMVTFFKFARKVKWWLMAWLGDNVCYKISMFYASR